MKIKVSTLVMVAVGLLVSVLAWPTMKTYLPGWVDLSPEAIAGFHQEDAATFVDGPCGLRFFEDGWVDVFIGEKKLGEAVRYTVGKGVIRIHHACGVWELVPRGDRLYHTEYRSYLSRKGEAPGEVSR